MKNILITTIASVLLAGTSFADPIHDYAWGNLLSNVDIELNNGIDVNKKNNIGDTPLTIAAYQGHKEIVKQLIANGADVNTKNNNGDTPIVLAAYQGHKETADIIRKHGGRTGEELALMPRLVQHGRFAFSFDAKEGKVYEVQYTFDLLNWEVIKIYTGTGSSVRFDEERDHDPPKWFYRVRVVE
jgi:ankyrin repeat protein